MRRYNQFHPISIKDNHFQSPVVPVFCVSTLKRFFSTKIRSPPRNLRKIPQRSECCGNRYLHYNYCSIIYMEHLNCRWEKGVNRDAISEKSSHGYGDTTQRRIDIESFLDGDEDDGLRGEYRSSTSTDILSHGLQVCEYFHDAAHCSTSSRHVTSSTSTNIPGMRCE